MKTTSRIVRLAEHVKTFMRLEDGPTSVEYAVMLALIIVVCIGTVTTLGNNVKATFNSVSNKLVVTGS